VWNMINFHGLPNSQCIWHFCKFLQYLYSNQYWNLVSMGLGFLNEERLIYKNISTDFDP
jgi:hypothetical protein